MGRQSLMVPGLAHREEYTIHQQKLVASLLEISTAQKGIWFLLNMKLTVSQQGSLVGKKVNSLWTALGLNHCQ